MPDYKYVFVWCTLILLNNIKNCENLPINEIRVCILFFCVYINFPSGRVQLNSEYKCGSYVEK